MESLEASTYEQYIPESESNSEYDTDSDDSDRIVQTHNIGYHNVHHDREHTFINDTKTKDYEKSRNDLFTPALSYDNIVIDSRNHSDDTMNRSSYVVKFDDEDQTTNNTEGYGTFKNVIGFKLIKANIPSRVYNIDTHNNTLRFLFDGLSGTQTAILTIGNYTRTTLASHLQNVLNGITSVSGFTVSLETTTNLLKIANSTSFSFLFADNVETDTIHLLLGFNKSDTPTVTNLTSDKPSLLETHFVDLVIPEIPYISCKKNATGKHLIDRIPINSEDGSMNYYVQAADYDKMSYFYPFDLHKITIQLYDESNQGLYTSKTDHFFEFELTMLNNPSIL